MLELAQKLVESSPIKRHFNDDERPLKKIDCEWRIGDCRAGFVSALFAMICVSVSVVILAPNLT